MEFNNLERAPFVQSFNIQKVPSLFEKNIFDKVLKLVEGTIKSLKRKRKFKVLTKF